MKRADEFWGKVMTSVTSSNNILKELTSLTTVVWNDLTVN